MRAHRARRGPAARGHRGPRPARLDVDRRAGARRRRGGPAAGRARDAHRRRHASSAARATSPASSSGSARRSSLLDGARRRGRRGDCPHFDYALPAYYLILPSECSTNLARFDAMRYGLRVGDDGTASAEEVMAVTRDAGFGAEVKRRIIIGTYALSSGYYDAYYGQAQKVRTLIARDFEAAFEQVDVLVSPTTPTTAFRLGERVDDPMAMYLADLCTIPSNLAGNASMSLPAGLAPDDGLPVGFQVMAPPMADDRLYRVGGAVEAALADRWGHLLIDEAPGALASRHGGCVKKPCSLSSAQSSPGGRRSSGSRRAREDGTAGADRRGAERRVLVTGLRRPRPPAAPRRRTRDLTTNDGHRADVACRLRGRGGCVRPGPRPRGARRARHRVEDVLRLRHRVRCRAEHARSARRASGCRGRCRCSTGWPSSRAIRVGPWRCTATSRRGAGSRGRTTSTRTCRRTSRRRSTTSRSAPTATSTSTW